jgi:hypothetical protein
VAGVCGYTTRPRLAKLSPYNELHVDPCGSMWSVWICMEQVGKGKVLSVWNIAAGKSSQIHPPLIQPYILCNLLAANSCTVEEKELLLFVLYFCPVYIPLDNSAECFLQYSKIKFV